jgi:formate hydrogenlyase subunit 3/multisubunit Na+/H+ antiporter MnhD subunit
MAAAFYASHHVLVKGALFLAVGVAAAGPKGRRAWVLAPALLLSLGLGGLPLTGGAIAKFAVKDVFGTGTAAALSSASAVGTTLLMLHFVRRLALTEVNGAGRAPAGLLLPWLVMAAAALLLPWAMFTTTGLGTAAAAIGLDASWQALWPVALGTALAFALRGRADRLPAVPEGDIAAGIEPAARLTLRLGAGCDALDDALRRWSVASAALVLVAMAIGWALLPS